MYRLHVRQAAALRCVARTASKHSWLGARAALLVVTGRSSLACAARQSHRLLAILEQNCSMYAKHAVMELL
jgi:hypothetical protein